MQNHKTRKAALMASCLAFCLSAFGLIPGLEAQTAQKKPYDSEINNLSLIHKVPADLIHSIIRAESNYHPLAVSAKGAVGLMQLMPATAKSYGVKDSFNVFQNLEGGVKYLRDLIKLFNGNTKKVLAAYNAGQEAVKKYNGIPPYRETRTYITRVMASYDKPIIPRAGGMIYKRYDAQGRLVLTNDPNFGFVSLNGNN